MEPVGDFIEDRIIPGFQILLLLRKGFLHQH
jgi:hypothetical protein